MKAQLKTYSFLVLNIIFYISFLRKRRKESDIIFHLKKSVTANQFFVKHTSQEQE